MESIDTENLVAILEKATDVVLLYAKEKDLADKLLDFETRQRERLVHDMIFCFKRGMSLSLELDAFNELVDQTFAEQSTITKGMKAYWKRNFAELQRQYAQRCSLTPEYVGFKWVSTLPSDAKFGLSTAQPTVRCQFQTTQETFAMDLSPEAVQDLASQLAAIQNSIQEIK